MMGRLEWVLVAASVSLLPANAGATTVMFDDVCRVDNCVDPIPAGYGGLGWSRFWVDEPFDTEDSGYARGRVSGDSVAFNASGDPATFFNGTPFDFVSTYLTAAFNTGLNITVEGFLGRNLLYTQTVVVDDQAPTLFTFNYQGVDSVRFTAFGGVDANPGNPGSGPIFAMDNPTLDNLTYTLPEPSTLLLLCGGLLAGARRLRRFPGTDPAPSNRGPSR